MKEFGIMIAYKIYVKNEAFKKNFSRFGEKKAIRFL